MNKSKRNWLTILGFCCPAILWWLFVQLPHGNGLIGLVVTFCDPILLLLGAIIAIVIRQPTTKKGGINEKTRN
jgi:hypothetical protein